MLLSIHVDRLRKEGGSIFSNKGKLVLVDLAGSESVKKTNTSGSSLVETAGINKSLLALSNVIVNLSKKTSGHVSWRDSKLTQILQDSLSGQGLTKLIACVSPSAEQLQETLATLQFATKAGSISKQTVQVLTPHQKEIRKLTQQWQQSIREVEFLRRFIEDQGLECPDYKANEQ